MKRILAVVLFMSLASAAFADGPGQKPPVSGTATGPHKVAVVPLADGSGGKPPGVVLLADGPGQKPPVSGTAAKPPARNVSA